MDNLETISISEFKATCLRVIEQIRRTGKQIIVTKNGEPAALVSPPPIRKAETKKRYCGLFSGKMRIVGDIVQPLDVEWEALKK